MCEQKSLSESDAFDIVFQVSSALQALHAHNICHFDVKLENINYRTEDPSCRTICLIDLGMHTRHQLFSDLYVSGGALTLTLTHSYSHSTNHYHYLRASTRSDDRLGKGVRAVAGD